MNYIPYPRTDKNTHEDLKNWRTKQDKQKGDWTSLKTYLTCNCRLYESLHPIPKCWYSELHQGDNYALDVEHFRPKGQAAPLQKKDIDIIEQITGFPLLQDEDENGKYPWLEFEYRNYRLVTATPNRGGGKHIYFPIFKSTRRLAAAEVPWRNKEYPILLDPTDKHDASLLLVTPDGNITPRTPKTELTQTDIDNLPNTWHNDAFNYVRAVVTIHMYRLELPLFKEGRREVYKKTTSNMSMLLKALNYKDKSLIEHFIGYLVESILPSAEFSLSAKCAMISYEPDGTDPATIQLFKNAIRSILEQVELVIGSFNVSWEND